MILWKTKYFKRLVLKKHTLLKCMTGSVFLYFGLEAPCPAPFNGFSVLTVCHHKEYLEMVYYYCKVFLVGVIIKTWMRTEMAYY